MSPLSTRLFSCCFCAIALIAGCTAPTPDGHDAGVDAGVDAGPPAPTCTDGIQNGTETDTDCGGATCPGCGVGKKCTATSDCASGEGCDVTTKTCDANECHDGAQDGTETDIDCGGGTCPACTVGEKCASDSDCGPGAGCDVTTMKCDSNQCHDGIQNGAETAIDCGGGTCPGCSVGQACKSTSDCAAGEGCDSKTMTCDPTTCNDGTQDGTETGVDCGGTCPGCAVGVKCNSTADCATGEGCDKLMKICDATTCTDGTLDGPETDIDCGGTCPGCPVNDKCNTTADCAAGEGCDKTTKTCDPTACTDGILDGTETDVDCGGTCPGCVVGEKCNSESDCVMGAGCDVTTKLCDMTQCHDGVQDGAETDVDCGGGICPECTVTQKCLVTSDCKAGEGCDKLMKICDSTTCNDGTQDGIETGVDCGGGCPGCPAGDQCNATSDCAAGEGCDMTAKICDGTTCNDGVQDGPETGVDCGGGCPGCPAGDACNATSDCATGEGCDVTAKICDGTTCNDGTQDGTETDIDCGGTCPGCSVNDRCNVNSDCASGVGCDVTSKTCDATTCNDGTQDGTETDVDCGGTCPGCPVNDKCNTTSDCLSGEGCDKTTNTCDATTCNDGTQDGTETDIDCGGTCPGCVVGDKCNVTSDCATGAGCDVTTKTCDMTECHDGVHDANETDVDCGGGTCAPCALTKKCLADTDCTSGACDATSLTCVSNQCSDHRQDGKETDVDCGGSCTPCATGLKCLVDTDCATVACDANSLTCVSNQCADHRQDGKETDVDCGGNCTPCATGLKCLADTDCTSGACDANSLMCVSNQCTDHRQDGNETDVDCGGNCTPCATGLKCLVDSDCTTVACDASSLTCVSNQCADHRQDGNETDVDCGGNCTPCAIGLKCLVDTDCTTIACDAVTFTCDTGQCVDHQQDGAETDVDCGGGTCTGCAVNKKCKLTSDCLTGEGCDVTTKTCDMNECNDGTQDGSETDVDCGGSICSACAIGKDCLQNGDCLAGDGCDKTTKRCDNNLCNDGLRDGNETDVDCGGGSCAQCALGLDCVVGSDCATGNCHAGLCSPACLNTTFSTISSQQQVTLPSTGTYTVAATGAQGAAGGLGGSGGLGALMQGNFPLSGGTVLQIVVGGRPAGPVGAQDGGAGGGGSFVYVSGSAFPLPTAPLLVAGGGGGGGGGGGIISTGSGAGGAAGTNSGSSGGAGGGGTGWLGAGGSNGGGGGGRWSGGGGVSSSGNNGGAGGFGGGGGAGIFNPGVSGAGGGYTGGVGGSVSGVWGSGGSSYLATSVIAGTTTATPATQSGSGYVKVIGPLSGTCP